MAHNLRRLWGGRLKLDIGCGPNPLPGYETVDINPEFTPTHCFDLDLAAWPLATARYDVVRAYHVLEHLVNPLQAARNIHRILKPGGLFVLQLPHEKSPDATRDWSHLHTRWNVPRIKWLANPTLYAAGVGAFELDKLHVERPILRMFDGGPKWRQWWEWRAALRYGNITATYRKRGVGT